MDKIAKYLTEFKSVAPKWFQSQGPQEQYEFFRNFFIPESLSKAEWPDFQKIGEHLNCFAVMPLARANALGRPNHPIEKYRASFSYLAHGTDAIPERIRKFHNDETYRLAYFGNSAVSELAGFLFPDDFVLFNSRDQFAAKFLEIKPKFQSTDDLVAKLTKFKDAVTPISQLYTKIVGRQTDLPLNLEIDQFFSWIYKTYSGHEGTIESPQPTASTQSEDNNQSDMPNETPKHWWINANPKIWNFSDIPIGGKQVYTSHNEQGNKRQKYKYFQEVKPGDLIIGYITSPDREIVALARVTKPLGPQEPDHAEGIEFEKIEQITNPIPLDELKKIPALKNSEPLVSNQGSLFRLTPDEFTVIRTLIDDFNPITDKPYVPFSKKDALKTLFLEELELNEMITSLNEKKNVILQGPPGVGKTFVAKKLAYLLMGEIDNSRVQMVQFHQSYSYEDFIQGFRPAEGGHFELKNGHFFQFCRKAQRDRDKRPFIFIVDEINRGNLSKILGEVMMLIEPDKRGPEFAIPLAYSGSADETFFVPPNVYLVGLMNTADRSLAMVDYALRRRFRFITLRPQFGSSRFADHLKEFGAPQTLISKIVTRFTTLNKEISADQKNLGPGYQIGHSFFCPMDGSSLTESSYASIVRSEIKPLLEEYWLDDQDKVTAQVAALID